MKKRFLPPQHKHVWGEQEGGKMVLLLVLVDFQGWIQAEKSINSKDRKVNTKMSIDLPLNPNIFILGDFDSITNISKDQGHFILRASLIGKKLILQKWKSAKEIKMDVRSAVEVLDLLGFFPHVSQTSVFKGPLVSSKPQPTLPSCHPKSSQPFLSTFCLWCSCRSSFSLPSMLFWRHKMLSAVYLNHQEKQGGIFPIGYFSRPPPLRSPLFLFLLPLPVGKHTETDFF